MISPEETAKKYDNRPGYNLINYREVGLPAFRLLMLLSLQEKSAIGPIEESILRCLKLGLNTASEVESFLGVPINVINQQIGALLYENAIKSERDGQYALSQIGVNKLNVAKSIKVTKEQIPIYVDGITRNVDVVNSRDLYTATDLERSGVTLILPVPRRPPRASEIDLIDINRMLRALSGDIELKKTALSIEALIGKTRLLYRRVVALIYKSETGRSIAVSFVIDGRLSEEHEIALARSNTLEQSKLFSDLFDSQKRRRNVQAVVRHVKDKLPTVVDELNKSVEGIGRKTLMLKQVSEERVLEEPSVVRQLHVYEHAPILERAFHEAKERILIISPWIRANVVNEQFINNLTNCLKNGVFVTIYYGLGKVDRGERHRDHEARTDIRGLGGRVLIT